MYWNTVKVDDITAPDGREMREYTITGDECTLWYYVTPEVLVINFNHGKMSLGMARNACKMFNKSFQWMLDKWNFDRAFFVGKNKRTAQILGLNKYDVSVVKENFIGQPGLNLYMVKV